MLDKPDLTYALKLGATAACGGLLFGFDVAIITGAGPFLTDHFRLDPLALGIAFSTLLFGCALGAVAAGPLSDRFGRRTVMLWVATVFAATSLATGVAGTFQQLLIARFFGGLAVGAVSLAAPTYVAEVSPPSIRGRMGALYQMSITVGIFVSYVINFGLRELGPDSWRWMFASGVLPSLGFFALVLTAPESPTFLLRRGRDADARTLIARIGGQSVDEAVARIYSSLPNNSAKSGELMTSKVLKPLGVSLVLAVLVHASGINTVVDYAPIILRSAGLTLSDSLLYTLLIGAVNVAFTVVSFWTIDRFGRKPLYLVGSLGMAAALAGLMLAVGTNRFEGPIVLGLIIVYVLFFCSCIGPVFWTLVPEIFPNSVRGRAMTAPVLTQWIANALVVLVFPVLFQQVGKLPTFGLLAGACLLQAAFVQAFVPETRGRSLEAIESFWRTSTSAPAPQSPKDQPHAA